MQRKMQTQERRYAKRSHRRHFWKRVVSGMTSAVMLATTCALILPAKALENPATCGVEEHTHTQSCYVQIGEAQETELSCTKEAQTVHEHTSECWGTESGTEGHVHGDACYTLEQGNLNCQLVGTEGHAHGSDCYALGEQPVCQQEESEEHTHGSECYESEPICTTAEEAAHQHAESCYEQNKVLSCTEEGAEPVLICTEPEVQEHVHGDDCKSAEQTLICKLPEHTHALACYSNPEADVENEETWEETLPEKLTGVFVDDLLAVAESQLGYTESEKNYEVLLDGISVRGYTRYGAWYGDPYGKWDGMFVAFCLHYAGADELEALADFPREVDATLWAAELEKASEGQETKLYMNAGEGTPEPGDLVFLDTDGDELHTADRVGILKETFEDKSATKLRVYEGDCENQVQKTEYALTDPAIIGYGLLPEVPDYDPSETTEVTEIPENLHIYSDDTVYVEVQLPEDTTVPADAVLKVEPIAEGSEEYESYVAKAKEAVDGAVENIALYDISFYTADGEYISVDNTNAKVSLAFNESPVDAEAEVQVLHFADEEAPLPEVISEVTHEEKEIEMFLETEESAAAETEPSAAPAAQTEEPADNAEETETVVEVVTETRTVVEFTTDGFSTFAVVEVVTENVEPEPIVGYSNVTNVLTHEQINDLDGLTIVISSAVADYAMTTEPQRVDTNEHRDAVPVEKGNGTVKIGSTDSILWEFEEVPGTDATNDYNIKVKGTGQYLNISTSGQPVTLSPNAQNIYVTAEEDGSAVTLTVKNNNNTIRWLSYNNAMTDKVNLDTTFASYGNPQDDVNQLLLSIPTVETKVLTYTAATDGTHPLDGRVFAISTYQNLNYAYPGVTAETTTIKDTNGNNVYGLKALNITRNDDGKAYVSDTMLWKFEKGDNTVADTYYIRSYNAETDASGGYLKIIANSNVTVVGDGVGDAGCRITVVPGQSTTTTDEVSLKRQTDNRYLSYVLDEGADTFTDYGTRNLGNNYRGDLILSEYVVEKTPDNVVTNLAGKTLAIVSVRDRTANNAMHVVTSTSGTSDKVTTGLQGVLLNGTLEIKNSGTSTISGDDATIPEKGYWTFEATETAGQYYIKNGDKYLTFGNGTAGVTDTKTPIVVTKNADGCVVLSIPGTDICLNRYGGPQFEVYAGFDGVANNGTNALGYDDVGANFVLVEPNELNTDLAGKVAFIAAVNNIQTQEGLPLLATTKRENDPDILTAENRDINIEDAFLSQEDLVKDTNNNLGWYFEVTDTLGVYHLVAANGNNQGKYLQIVKKGLKMVDGAADASEIEVISADTSGIPAEGLVHNATEDVVCLRTKIGDQYYYVNLNYNYTGDNFTSYSGSGVSDRANHFKILEDTAATEVVAKINELVDGMEKTTYTDSETGEVREIWQFDSTLTGTAVVDNNNDNYIQGALGQNDKSFRTKYDDAQAKRYAKKAELQEQMPDVKEAFNKLTEEEKRYVLNSSALDGLSWVLCTIGTVNPVDVDATVKLYNYDGRVNEAALAGNGRDREGFTFYHKIQYDGYTALVDPNRYNSNKLGGSNSEVNFDTTLNKKGYPVVTGPGLADGVSGDLDYLFDDTYHVATMGNGGGLFQRDDDGYYYYYSNVNAAYYTGTGKPMDTDGDGITDNKSVEDGGKFVLYDHVIRPMYIDGDMPNAVNDVYNFLPFNDPLTAGICDPVNYIPSNTKGAINQVQGLDDGDAFATPKNPSYTKKYIGDADSTANRAKSAYLNERPDLWFGMTIDVPFMMPQKGVVKSPKSVNQDMIFEFYGDDDVMVYIDGVLVIDLGGVHSAEEGKINFKDGTVSDTSDETAGTLREIFLAAKGEAYVKENFDGSTFKDFSEHTMNFFFMERGGNVSYCGIKFNFPPVPENTPPTDPTAPSTEPSSTSDDELPQTGQLNWPVPVMALAGMLFITMGCVLRFDRRKGRYAQ